MACRNRQLAQLRAAKRAGLLKATAVELDRVCTMVVRGQLVGADKIGVRGYNLLNVHKMVDVQSLSPGPSPGGEGS